MQVIEVRVDDGWGVVISQHVMQILEMFHNRTLVLVVSQASSMDPFIVLCKRSMIGWHISHICQIPALYHACSFPFLVVEGSSEGVRIGAEA